MKIQIEIRRPRWLPAKLRWRTRIALVTAALLAVAVPVAWASHDFADVPTTHPFHNQINAIKTAGITQGCGGGNYCPDEFVRRDAMAAFLQRGLGRGGRGSGSSSITANGFTLRPAATTTLTVPGAGFVLVTGSLVAQGGSGCPCIVSTQLKHDGSGAVSDWFMYDTIDNTAYASAYAATSATWMFPVTAGTHTFSVNGTRFNGSGTTTIFGQITALWVPFGSGGGTTLGASAPATTSVSPTQGGR